MSKSVVMILGMHRSGTSLAARAFATAGMPLGHRLLLAPRADNPDGYWEDEEIVETHERLMVARFGSNTAIWGVEVLDDVVNDSAHPARAEAIESLRTIVVKRLASEPAFAFKDPRTARLLPLWLELARKENFTLVPVLAVRRPGEVAGSLEKRNGIPRVIGELMWLRTIADVLTHVGHDLLATIAYDDWFNDTDANASAINRVLLAVGVSPRPSWSAPVSTALRHEREPAATLPLTGWTYEQLVRRGTQAPDARALAEIRKRIDAVAGSFGGWTALARALQGDLHRSNRIALPLPATQRPKDVKLPMAMPASAELLHGNRWCRELPHGYLLHANRTDNPYIAALRWRAIRMRGPVRLRGRLAAARQGPALLVRLELLSSDGEPIAYYRMHLTPGAHEVLDVAVPIDRQFDIRLGVEVAPPAVEAHYAGLMIGGLHLSCESADGQ